MDATTDSGAQAAGAAGATAGAVGGLAGGLDAHTRQQGQPQTQAPSAFMLPKKNANPLLGRFQKSAAGGGGAFKSPTDNLMSPATQKVEAKRKHHLASIKPTSLQGRFAQAGASEPAASSSSSATDAPF
ncbi:hypothetical protein BC831DRAFT_478240 [Entophlyctis helioformis]|nr:hypothetical protein BC831DRAFT_478240 [Entophlyctis helioformis]